MAMAIDIFQAIGRELDLTFGCRSGSKRTVGAMRLLAWNEGYATGLDTVDAVHRELMDSINRLVDEPAPISGARTSHMFFDRLCEALEQQFRREEKMMLDCGGIGFEAHLQDHERLREEIHELAEVFGDAEEIDFVELSVRLEPWFVRHFRTHDSALYDRMSSAVPGAARSTSRLRR